MNNDAGKRTEPTLAARIEAKAKRKVRAKRSSSQGVWIDLGTMGLIGWSVAVPTLLGAALGLWLDRRFPSQHSWTLAMLMAGLAIGCFNAWRWVDREDKAMRDEREDSVE